MDPSDSDPDLPTPLSGGNAPYVESLYETYLRDPLAVALPWRNYFDDLGRPAPAQPAPTAAAPLAGGAGVASEKQGAVSRLLQTTSNRGHLVARIDPLGLMHRERPRVLDPAYVGLGEADLDTEFYTGSRNEWIAKRATLREILARLEQVYCGTIGAEFAHVSATE